MFEFMTHASAEAREEYLLSSQLFQQACIPADLTS
jgi:hypothetical protein